MVRQYEAHRPGQVRRVADQHLALDQRLADQPERVDLEIAQAAVDQLGRFGRRARGQVVLLDQQPREAAARRVARDPYAVDAAPDNGEIEVRHEMPLSPPRLALNCPPVARRSSFARAWIGAM